LNQSSADLGIVEESRFQGFGIILASVGALPTWGYSRDWGYAPGGGLGLILLIVVVLALTGHI
jgi:hypothetical protein